MLRGELRCSTCVHCNGMECEVGPSYVLLGRLWIGKVMETHWKITQKDMGQLELNN